MKRVSFVAFVPWLLSSTLAAPLAAAPAPAPAGSAAPAPAPAQPAQPSSEARAMAETLFFTGRGLMEAGRLEEACTKFAESYRLDAAAGTLLNLAVCHEKTGKIASAWGEFRQALFDARKAGRADREALAQEHISKLEPDLPYMIIRVPAKARVPGLEVVRNGSVLTQGGWDAELPVDPGTVEIVTRAPGYKPKTKKVKIELKEHLEVTVEPLEKAPVPVVVVGTPGWSTERKIGFGLLGLGVAGLGVGGYFGYRAFDAKNKSDDACPMFDGEHRCSTVGVDQMKAANRDAWISNISIGVGLGAALVGTYMFIHGGNTKPEAPKTGSSSSPRTWSVSVGPTRGGMSGMLVGSF